MKIIIYKCDICGDILSDESIEPKIAKAHINIKNPDTFRLSVTNENGTWINKRLNYAKSNRCIEQQYCIHCLIEKLKELI